FSLLLTSMLEVFTLVGTDDYRDKANRISLYFVLLAIGALIVNALQMGMFGHIGENLTLRIRVDVFNKLLKMPMSWFDHPDNTPGALAAKLATDAALINSLTASTIGISIQAFASFAAG